MMQGIAEAERKKEGERRACGSREREFFFFLKELVNRKEEGRREIEIRGGGKTRERKV